MRERVNHKSKSEKPRVDSHFWEEYRQRGFKIDHTQGGTLHSEIRKAHFSIKGQGQYEIAMDEKNKFNIVSAVVFMKTVAQIEGLVKYKLFK
jgi:hypothetical protein